MIGSTVVLAAEGVVERVDAPRQREHRLASRVEAGRVVVGHHERTCRPGLQTDLILQGVDGVEIGRIVGVDEDSRGDEHVVGVEPVDRQLVLAGTCAAPR